MEWLRNKRRQRNAGVYKTADLETPQERRRRWMSIRIIYFTMFIMTLGFSIVLTGVWPFLDSLDPHAGKSFLGYVVAANPLAQMLFSPLFGYWANKIGSVRIPLITSLAFFILSSSAYSLLELFPSSSVKYWMLATRFLVGVSSANVAICRSYLSSATTLRERTGAVSMISLAQVLGFIIGPAIQTAVSPLGAKGFALFGDKVHINMYTAAGWVNVLLAAINFFLLLPCCFAEQPIAAKEAQKKHGAATEEEAWKGLKPDMVATWSLILAFFILTFNFVLLETLGVPLVMDQFAWTKEESLKNMGLLMTVGAVVALVTFASLKPLTKKFDERALMLYGGFFLMVLGRIVHIPWGSEPPAIKTIDMISNLNGTEVVGCPVDEQPWCANTPAMTFVQFLLGYFLTSIGYPIGITVIQTLFSKILGPRPQGVWQGLMTGSGCFSRVLGPVFLSFIYVNLGTVWTFSLTSVMMALCCLWLRLVYSRLVPPQLNSPMPLSGHHQPQRTIVVSRNGNGAVPNRSASEKEGSPEELQALK